MPLGPFLWGKWRIAHLVLDGFRPEAFLPRCSIPDSLAGELRRAVSSPGHRRRGCRVAFDAVGGPVAYWHRQPRAVPDPVDLSHDRTPAGGSSISLEAEVPEVLFEGMRDFLRAHPQWDQYSLITSALAGFLFQNGCSDHSVTQHYLDGLFLQR